MYAYLMLSDRPGGSRIYSNFRHFLCHVKLSHKCALKVLHPNRNELYNDKNIIKILKVIFQK